MLSEVESIDVSKPNFSDRIEDRDKKRNNQINWDFSNTESFHVVFFDKGAKNNRYNIFYSSFINRLFNQNTFIYKLQSRE